MIMLIILIIIITYLIGAIPSSYLIVKLLDKKDIFANGTGNPGAMNSYEVTGKKHIGAIVLIADVLKGILAAYLSTLIAGEDIRAQMIGLIWVVIGNNYNLFFSGKGGRGLATAAGAFGIINPMLVVSWLVAWAMGYNIIQKNVHIANTIALIGGPLLVFSSPTELFEITQIIPVASMFSLKITYTIVCFIIIFRHIKPLKELAGIKEKEDGIF